MLKELELRGTITLSVEKAGAECLQSGADIPRDVLEMLEPHVGKSPQPSIVNNPSQIPGAGSSHGLLLGFSINHTPRNNELLFRCNQSLIQEGLLMGWSETYQTRKSTLKDRYPKPLFFLAHSWDSFLHRFIPKIPGIGALHDRVLGNEKRLMSKVEMTGRLYAAGFELIREKIVDGRQYFLAQKTTAAIQAKSPTYAPLVKLKRVGLQGREFHIYKFRTMYPYSEYLQEMIFTKNNLQAGGKFKDDFRISKFGRLLRKIWLDELPMIWNVLRGDIKIVGVRPLSRHYFNLYSDELRTKRTQFRPGLLPPFYADLPKTLDEIMASEMRYLQAYEKSPLKTDIRYFFRILRNIVLRGARSA